MKISEKAIRRGITTAMCYVLLVLLGSVAIPKIPLEFMPKLDVPFVEIHVPYEGASPVEICDKIAEPIEESVATLPGIDKIRSRCSPGYGYIGLELASSANMDYMVMDVQERIDAVRNELPDDVRNIMIMKFDTEQFPVIMGALTFTEDRAENNRLIERYIVRPLKTLDGVADIRIEGLEERRVLVEMNEDRLTNYGVSVIQVFESLTSGNMTMSAGSVDYADKTHNVRIVGEFQDLEDIRDLPLNSKVDIRDVANVHVDYVEPYFVGRFNRRRAYFLTVLKESGANTVEVCRNVRERLDELLASERLEGARLKIWFDQSQEITTSLDILVKSGVAGALLAFFVLWLFLRDFRSTLIVSAAVPMSILATIACMYFMGLTFNMITLSGLIVAVGMLVDNSVVILEAIDLRHRQGMSPIRAAIFGAREVGLAISVATTTTLIVFLPLIFVEKSMETVLMRQMGIVLVLSIGSSLVVSLTLIPLLASRIMKPTAGGIPRWYAALSDRFIRLLEKALRHRLLAMSTVGAIFIVSVLIFIWPSPWDKNEKFKDYKFYPLIEKEAIPKALLRIVRIKVDFEKKPTLKEVDRKMALLERMFMDKREDWGIDTVAAIVSQRVNRILLVLPFDETPKYTAAEVQDKAREYVKKNVNWPGIKLDVGGEGMGGGPPGMGGMSTSIKVRGPDPHQVYKFAEDIRKKLLTIDGLKEIKPLERSGEEEVHVIVDRLQAKQFGFDPSQVAMAISYSIRGVPVGQLLSAETPLDIYIQIKGADEKSLPELQSMMVQNMRGEYIPLKNIASFRQVPIPDMVRRDNRLITVRIPVIPKGKDLGTVSKRIHERLANYRLPSGYSWVLGEEFQEVKRDLMVLGVAILLAMVLVFLVMTAQFESFFLPFVIMFTLPFAMIGVVLALLISRATFNILSGAGCLLLVGIVVNNAIVLVDHIHNLRKRGYSHHDSLINASRDRLRPIMMTALTTIVGLLPMALGLNDTGRMMYSPLAIAVLGGLLVSTFLTPFIIPMIYSIFDDVSNWLRVIARAVARL
ncbi:MAG: efflux RND transporter permease subunit [bacterium]